MDMKLIEQFLLELCPADGLNTINMAFDQFTKNIPQAGMTIGGFISHAQIYLQTEDTHEQVKVIRYLLTGVMIAYASSHPELKQTLMVNFIEMGKKKRGENVVSFNAKKAEK